MIETNASPRTAMADPGPAPESTERKRILLVEGDGFTRLVLLLRLRLAGFGVDFTSNGTIGLGKLRSCHPDILLVELKLCGLSGLDLIRAARAEAGFGRRPIYVFTNTNRLHRAVRKEVEQLGVKLFDKNTTTRENLVQILETSFFKRPTGSVPASAAAPEAPLAEPLSEKAVTGAIQELVAGVREQCELFMADTGEGTGRELLSRVSSLESCSRATGLPSLARQAKALENLLKNLCTAKAEYSQVTLSTISRAVEVMNRLSRDGGSGQKRPSSFTAVLVDEAPPSRRATEKALVEANFQPECFELPGRAREYLERKRTDVIIANVALPEAHGLALGDVRRLKLHKDTPVIFGPESSRATAVNDDMPVSAPRLDKSPLLLAELVVRALNEVQSAGLAEPVLPQDMSLRRSAEQSFQMRGALPDLPFEDRVDLFAQAPRGQQTLAPEPGEPGELASEDHLFGTGRVPGLRAEPGTPGEDLEVQFLAPLPVTPVDPSQPEEHPEEFQTPFGVQTEAPQEPESESPFTGQTAQSEWVSAPDSHEGIPPTVMASDAFEIANASASQPADESTPTPEEIMNNQIRVATADYMQHDDALHNGLNGDHHSQNDTVAEQSAQARCAELEQEIAALRQAFEGLNGGFGELQQDSPGSNGRVQELEQKLKQNAAELESQKEEQLRNEYELSRRLEEANAANHQSAVARQQAEERCAQLAKELEEARRSREEQPPKAAQTQNGNGAGAPASDLELQVHEQVAALAQATAELAIERGERQRNQQRVAELSGRLQTLHQDLSRTLEAQRQDLARLSALEEQQRQTSQALERSTADAEQRESELRLAEAQLQKAKEHNAQLRKDLSFFEETNKDVDGSRQQLHSRLEASLKAARETEARLQHESAERQRLAENFEEAQRELQNQARRHEALAEELESTRQTLQDREAKLQKQAAERQREESEDPSRDLQNSSERDLEFSKIRSALQLEQVERKKQESELARTRQSALDSAHAARALRTSMRRQIREPVDNVIHSARNLLELEMGDDQKKLAQAVLQDCLLVQARLREPALAQGDSADTNVTSK